jgi:hypothetical protein
MDLWPLYLAGEASQDTKDLIDLYLKEDKEFADMLAKDDKRNPVKPVAITVPPDLEARSFARTRRCLQDRSVFRILALTFTGLGIVRLATDWPFTKTSPMNALGTLTVALIFWIAFFVHRKYLQSAAR